MRATKYLVIVFLVSLTATLAKNEVVKREGKFFRLCTRFESRKGNSSGRNEMSIETCLSCCLRIGRSLPGTSIVDYQSYEPAGPNEPKECRCPASTEDVEEYERLAEQKPKQRASRKAPWSWIVRRS
jgi:hypothetical protein